MDCLQDWPEPVVWVQSLSCMTIIPPRYIKPPSERPSLNSIIGDEPSHELSIPIVDLNCNDTVRSVSEAGRGWGFFQVINHGVDTELMRRAREDWREFFHLPMEEKQMYANSPKTYEGYGSRLGIEKGAILDWGDYYFLNLLPLCLKNYEKWPVLPPSLSINLYNRGTVEEYGSQVINLCERVMRILSLGLGLGEGHLQKAFGSEDIGVCMRVNFYPKCPQPELALGLSSHSDPGGITVPLPDDRVKGLQVRRGDQWITVQPVPDTFIVIIGDQIQVLSNATYKSVEHRAMVNAETERISIAFFYNPKSDLLLSPLPELVSPDRPPLYAPMTYKQYRLHIRQHGAKGKSQVESLKAL